MTVDESTSRTPSRVGNKVYPWLIAFAVALAVIGAQAPGSMLVVLAIVAAVGYVVLTQPGYDRRRWLLLLLLPIVGLVIGRFIAG